MNVLMFGWEFPPHISGGLGTACYGLTKGLSSFSDINLSFVVPKVFGGEDTRNFRLIGAGDVTLSNRKIKLKESGKSMECLEVSSTLVPYTDPEAYFSQTSFSAEGTTSTLVETDPHGKIKFTGRYGPDLFDEIERYALVARIIAKDVDFDVIHAHDWLTFPAGIAAKQLSGKPLVIHVHATDFDRSGGSANPRVYAVEKQGMDAADMIITVSNYTRTMVIEKYAVDPKKVITVYNAVEPPLNTNKTQVSKGFDEKVVTFLGRITTQKGPEYFVEAACSVLQKTDKVRFVMAGSGDLMDRMIRRAAQLHITDKFHFTGFLKGDEVTRMFRMSDVFVMPSVSEPFGISPLEALLAGVPVIISRQSGVSEILSNAIKVDFWDVEAIANAIYGMLNYPALSSMLSKNGRKETYQLSWTNTASKVRQIYHMALSA